MPATSTLTVRLPDETRDALDRAAEKLQRSRAFLIRQLVDRHLDDVVRAETPGAHGDRFARIRALALRGGELSRFRSAEEVDAFIREGRGDD